jgi:hypothetical protein
MLWELKPDCHNPLIAEAIRRDEVVAVVKALHFRDNADMDGDAYYKVRPIIDNLNKTSSKWNVDADSFAVDEIMIPYYGRHGSKRFIHGKPIRYGFKVWAVCTSSGSGVWFEPYCGKDTRVDDQGLGQGPNVVLDLVVKVRITKYFLWYQYLCVKNFVYRYHTL